ncbi:hypothetical protein NC653_032435 [Populus alba x Populus x berolinensis]|uniref:Uncharacterized protein n=1 Tax=Populus alba x Populus x berolinensis TaxID=444605 RepID=A0AAD6LRC9_9ROSI|nr:hypothetical protein NC653_032435 [Populus alba x Populus x berolinensis]
MLAAGPDRARWVGDRIGARRSTGSWKYAWIQFYEALGRKKTMERLQSCRDAYPERPSSAYKLWLCGYDGCKPVFDDVKIFLCYNVYLTFGEKTSKAFFFFCIKKAKNLCL